MNRLRFFFTAVLAGMLAAPASAQFTYAPAGELQSAGGAAPRPGAGRADDTVYSPGMRFPIEAAPAYLNSQIYGHGGYMGPGGGQCTDANYDYPWYDNYCEARRWTMPLCPSGNGHQGQDIRPGSCDDSTHWAVATVDGRITNIGSYSVYLTGDDGSRYDYLHLDMSRLEVRLNQRVSRGDRIGLVSNDFGGTPTTIHLHFNIRQTIAPHGSVYAPTYMSLVRSYEELLGGVEPRWRAEVIDHNLGDVSLAAGERRSFYVEVRNTGTETWTAGSVALTSTEPRGGASPLEGPTWPAPHQAAINGSNVAPNGTVRFSFMVEAPTSPGSNTQHFGFASGSTHFADDGGPEDTALRLQVRVGDCGSIGAAWQCAGDGRSRCVDGNLEHEACDGCTDGTCDGSPRDDDRDGHNSSVDCDDNNPSIHPGADDPCGDGVDANCDGYDACRPGEDSGLPRTDAGTPPLPEPERQLLGNGCAAAGQFPIGTPLLVLVSLALLHRRKRR